MGEITLLGHRLPQEGPLARARVGVVPQHDNLDPDFTVRENLLVYAHYFGLSSREIAARIPAHYSIKQGKTLLLTTHFMDEAERRCDQLSIIDHGEIIAEGAPRALLADQIEPHVVYESSSQL